MEEFESHIKNFTQMINGNKFVNDKNDKLFFEEMNSKFKTYLYDKQINKYEEFNKFNQLVNYIVELFVDKGEEYFTPETFDCKTSNDYNGYNIIENNDMILLKLKHTFWYGIEINIEYDIEESKFTLLDYAFWSINGKGSNSSYKNIRIPLNEDEAKNICNLVICDDNCAIHKKFEQKAIEYLVQINESYVSNPMTTKDKMLNILLYFMIKKTKYKKSYDIENNNLTLHLHDTDCYFTTYVQNKNGENISVKKVNASNRSEIKIKILEENQFEIISIETRLIYEIELFEQDKINNPIRSINDFYQLCNDLWVERLGLKKNIKIEKILN